MECGSDGYPEVWHRGLMLYGNSEDQLHVHRRDKHSNRSSGPQISENGWFQMGGVKDYVRALAGHRCERCRHPYRVGASGYIERDDDPSKRIRPDQWPLESMEDDADAVQKVVGGSATHWSDCDERCRHGGPMRAMTTLGWHPFDPEPEACGAAVATLGVGKAQAAWRILTVHHLNGRKHDLRWWNLLTCCQRCHLWIQGHVKMEQVYPYEHDEWFKPYAAGWYAYAYLGEDLTRAETTERLEELLALERMV